MRLYQQDVFRHVATQGRGMPIVILIILALLPRLSWAQACWEINGTETVVGTKTVACVEVEEGDKLVIASGTLILNGDPNDPNYPGNISRIDGEITMEDESSTLCITTNNHTFTGTGTGEIVGEDPNATVEFDAVSVDIDGVTITGGLMLTGSGTIVLAGGDDKIEIGDGETLINRTTIEGCGRIDEVSGSGTFHNDGVVHADDACVLELAVATITDTPGDRWKVSGSDTAVLRFSCGAARLVGNIIVGADPSSPYHGTLDIQTDITTSGSLNQKAVTTIQVAPGKTFQAS